MPSKDEEWHKALRSIAEVRRSSSDIYMEQYIARKFLAARNRGDIDSFSQPDSSSDSESSVSLSGLDEEVAFKVSRKALQRFVKKNWKSLGVDPNFRVEHSFLAIPDIDNGVYTLAAVMRGKRADEGIVGHGTQGKVLGIDLVIDGAEYCVKVMPHSEDALKEHAVMQHLSNNGLKKPQWYFCRDAMERSEDMDGSRDDRWIYGSEIKDKGYLIQELVQGKPLVDLFDENNPSPLLNDQRFVLKVSLLMATELKKYHDVGLIHNDLNLGNIMLQNENDPKKLKIEIIDFGLSQIYDDVKKLEFMEAKKTDIAQLGINMRDLGLKDDPIMGPIIKDMRFSVPMDLDSVISKLHARLEQVESKASKRDGNKM